MYQIKSLHFLHCFCYFRRFGLSWEATVLHYGGAEGDLHKWSGATILDYGGAEGDSRNTH